MSDSMEQEKSNADTDESRAKRHKGKIIKLNIIFGVMMFGSAFGTLLKGGSISSDNMDILGGVLIIGIVTGILGVLVTNAVYIVYIVISLLSGLKSAVRSFKNGS